MATPVGHSLIGLAIALQRILPAGRPREWGAACWRGKYLILLAVFLANAPDLDYVPGLAVGALNAFHHYYTHSICWTLLLAIGLGLVWRAADAHAGWGILFFFWALLLSHLALDLFTEDSRPPLGIMLAWPLSDDFYLSPVFLFRGANKATVAQLWQLHNLKVALWDTAVCLPWVALVIAGKLCRQQARA